MNLLCNMYSFNCWDFGWDVNKVIMHGNVTSIVQDKAAVIYFIIESIVKVKTWPGGHKS